MTVRFELPAEMEQHLRRTVGDLDQTAKEAALIELYRQDKVTQHELSEALGISRMETQALLKRHNVVEDLPTAGEIEQDVQDVRRFLERR